MTTSASAWPRPAWPTAGGRHLGVVAEDGAVYTCGSGEYGRQGLGDEQPRRRLTRVPQAVLAGSRVVIRELEDPVSDLVPWSGAPRVRGRRRRKI